MIAGFVTDDLIPTIFVHLGGTQWRAVVDSGFNGDLELPEQLRESVHARFRGRASSLLAGGITIDEDQYLVTFPFDGRNIKAEATFVAGDEILIGTQLLRDYRLEIDFVARTVRIERSSAATTGSTDES